MKRNHLFQRSLQCLALSLALFVTAAPIVAQGADVIVGDLNGIANYTSVGAIDAFSVGTTSCNIGTVPLLWISSNNQHPVIGQNMYRIRDNVFEQIGMSWLKHGFFALQQNLCQPCNANPDGSALGVGCSDPYGASLNGSQSGLGPRSQVNAANGYYPYPPANPSYSTSIDRRLQVAHSDLNPALNVGARYLIEGHYVTPDDAAAGNGFNNASYREITISGGGSEYTAALQGPTVRELPAIYAWQAIDPTVTITPVDFQGDGRFLIGHKEIPQAGPGGFVKHVYAVHNLNSDRSGGCFSVNVQGGTGITQPTFHDVPHHSGEPYNSTDWTPFIASNGIEWRIANDYNTDPDGNALRWSTCYTFTFVTDGTVVNPVISLFKPEPLGPTGTPASGVTYPVNQTAAYDFVNLSGVSTQAGPTGDDDAVTANIGFPFPFFDLTLNSIQISSNGYLAIPGTGATEYTNGTIPSPDGNDGIIAGFWDDLNPSNGGTISYATVGTTPNRRFVVDYTNVPHFPNSGSYSFQIILEENGDITSTIVSVTNGGDSATRGVESPDGLSGTQASFNTAGSAPSNSTWTYTYTPGTPPMPGAGPPATELFLIGQGDANSMLGLQLRGPVGAGIIVLGDISNGPTPLGALGSLDVGFSPAMFALADFTGFFGSLNGNDYLNDCGTWTFSLTLPSQLPAGINLYFQAVVPDVTAPNGQFHISNGVNLQT